jgi:hypothetical protein
MKALIAAALLLASAYPVGALAQEQSIAAEEDHAVELADNITLRVTEVRRFEDKGVMQLLFTVENRGDTDTTLMQHGLALAFGLGDIAIIDFGGRKQYRMGFANGCLCSSFPDRDGGVVRAGETEEFWAWFGLPNDGVSSVAVQFPNLQPIMNVPVS